MYMYSPSSLHNYYTLSENCYVSNNDQQSLKFCESFQLLIQVFKDNFSKLLSQTALLFKVFLEKNNSSLLKLHFV